MLKNYIKIAVKVLLRRKFFTFISLFAISFTLVVLMVVTAMLDNMFAPGPPETKQERTLGVFTALMMGESYIQVGNAGYGFLSRYVKTLPDVEMVSIYSTLTSVSTFVNGSEVRSQLKHTDAEYWKLLEFEFLEGGPITSDDEANANPVCVINESTRRRIFADAPALGKTIECDRRRFRVCGVVPDVPQYRQVSFADIWAPISTIADADYRDRLTGEFNGLILARDESDFDRIRKDFDARLAEVPLPNSNYDRFHSRAETIFEAESREAFGGSYSTEGGGGDQAVESYVGTAAGILILSALLFMLLPTVNLVNINVSRIIERSSEIGVRKSFGASSRTLVGQFIVENLMLTAIGGVLGFAGTAIALGILNASEFIPYARFSLNLNVFFYGFLLILVFGLISGVYPAWRMSRIHPVNALRGVVK